MAATDNISSPLRYPGGKSRISTFLVDIILVNNLEGCHFHELYAGGAGAALNLLLSGIVSKITLNDLDPHIYMFWKSILENTDDFLKLIHDSKINIDNWKKQKEIYTNYQDFNQLEVGFSTFFLNRCNRSGILFRAGPIGGMNQLGNYKIDVRFNRVSLTRRIERIVAFKSKIDIKNQESIKLITRIFRKDKKSNFIFLDPPYYDQGKNLYLNFYTDKDHIKLRNILKRNNDKNWFLTYDNCDAINDLYYNFRKSDLPMTYTLQSKRKSKEVMIFPESLHLPKNLRVGKKKSLLELK